MNRFVSSRWPRRVTAFGSVLAVCLTMVLSAQVTYGLDPTVSPSAPVNNDPAISLVAKVPDADAAPAPPLSMTWVPPVGMPSTGKSGQLTGADAIPTPASDFPARNAEIYYPPAALVKNPPRLPFVLMMMGQPGNPTAGNIAAVLDRFAAKHGGLAPIVIVADQLGSPTKDPLCLNSTLGKAESCLMNDVTRWARVHLNILQSPSAWTIAGYSNGGECANYFGAKYPGVWGNILDVSGIEYAGAEQPATILKQIFAGNQAAYDAVKPARIMSATRYRDNAAIYTAGEKDPALVQVQQRMAKAATRAGLAAQYVSIPGADHGVTALDGGLIAGFGLLYPRLGLK